MICGTPTPATTRVVQIEPGPIPTFTTSTPTSNKARVPSPVATFPAINVASGNVSRISLILRITPALCPCAVSMTMASAPASSKAFARSNVSEVIPTAAATSKRPCSSFAAFGNSITFSISLMVINPAKRPFSSTSGNFSILCF